jgi:hypothetical protein
MKSSIDVDDLLRSMIIDAVSEVGDCSVSFNDEDSLWKSSIVRTDDSWEIEFRIMDEDKSKIELVMWDRKYPQDQGICRPGGYAETSLEYQGEIDLHDPESQSDLESILREKCEMEYWGSKRGCIVIWWTGDGREEEHYECNHEHELCHYDHSECFTSDCQ